jgi:hypothetical protein
LEKVPLEAFYRHVLVTHLKGNADCILDRLEQRTGSGESFANLLAELVEFCYPKNPEWLEDKWYRSEVPLNQCYIACDDFRLYPLVKNERFVSFLNDNRQKIESGSFPCALDICSPWSGEMRAPLAVERETGKYFILDGQLRVIWHWYNNVPNVKVFIYKGDRRI